MLRTVGSKSGNKMATTVTLARIISRFSIPKRAESGAAIAKPTGAKIIEPISSKADNASDYVSAIVQM